MNVSIRTLAVLVSVVAAWPASAQCPLDTTTVAPDDLTCYVSNTTGRDENSGTSTSPMKTIQAALNRVAAGTEFQTVRVLPGTYDECPFLGGSNGQPGNVDIVADDFLTRGVITTTTVDGTECVSKAVPVFELGDNSKLRGFTITGGGNSGVAAYGHVTISNNVIFDNVSPTVGGGVYLETGANVQTAAVEARIANNTITNNKAVLHGGGIFVDATGNGSPSRVVIDANTVSNNVGGEGAVPRPNLFFINGGGITVWAGSLVAADRSTVVITTNTIEGNEVKGIDERLTRPWPRRIDTPSYGGGVYVSTFGAGTETVDVKSTNVIRNNKATRGYGGGIAAIGFGHFPGEVTHDVLIDSNAVSGNTATFGGGGIYGQILTTTAMDASGKLVMRILANNVAGNATTGAADQSGVVGGGGIFAEFFNEQTASTENVLIVDGNALRNNTSESFGGGASLSVRTFGQPVSSSPAEPASSRLRFANNLVTGNTAEDTQTDDSLGEGGGAFILTRGQGGGTSAIDFKFNTVANNTADAGRAGGVAILATNTAGATSPIGSSSVDISNSILLSNSGFAVGGSAVPGVENTTVRIAYNDTFDNGAGPFAPQYTATAGPGNITVDPELDAFFVPLLCSPTIDAGDPAEGTRASEGGLQEERQPNGSLANLGHTGLTLNSTVTLPDATGDALVDGADILRLATSFASDSSNVGRYNPAADLDKDDDIEGSDLAFMSAWFGKACP